MKVLGSVPEKKEECAWPQINRDKKKKRSSEVLLIIMALPFA